MKIKKVLVTDGESRKALCAVRTLGKHGFEVYVCSNQKINLSASSKYCFKSFLTPDPIMEKERYLEQIQRVLKKYNIDVILPMEDDTVELFILNKDILGNTKSLLPNHDSFIIARDKALTMQHATLLSIPIPETHNIKEGLESLNEIQNDKFPLIIKPRMSSGSRGISVVKNKTELIEKYPTIHKEYSNPVVQQYLTGEFEKIQVLVLFDENHELKLSCTYQGIREFPVDGGPVTLWKTVQHDEVEDKTIRFLKNINWTGFAEVEYVFEPSSEQYYLMEINPRFSANIALAVGLEIDFPLYFAKISLNEEVEAKRNEQYEQYAQWLLPGDIMNFIFNKGRFKQEIGYFFKKPMNLTYAIGSKHDVKPAIINILTLFVNIKNNVSNLLKKI